MNESMLIGTHCARLCDVILKCSYERQYYIS